LCFGACAALDQDALEALLEEQRGILWGDGYAPFVGVCLADDSNCKVCVGSRGNGRDEVGRSSSVAFVSGGQDPRDAWTELLSLLVPLLRRTVERSNMASWSGSVRSWFAELLQAGYVPRSPRLDRRDSPAAERMPARHCPSVGRIVDEFIMVEGGV